jgi:hypothetical protein
MKIDQNLQTRLELTFRTLNTIAAAKSFPPPTTLARELEKVADPLERAFSAPTNNYQASVNPDISIWFTTAAIEIWQRAVHSFLISASLTNVSPIWASVSGYYSSHYSVRALAHLLGYFQLFRYKRIVRLELSGGSFICKFDRKHGDDREHQFYWRVVNQNPYFGSDPLFIPNNSNSLDDASDAGHREKCNYADHVAGFPQFNPLASQSLLNRIEHISQIEFSAPPIPRRSKFPDVESVQIVAYHRLVRFRQFVDEIAGGSNRFWGVHRNPSWAREIMNFQLTEQGRLSSPVARR